MEVKEKKTVLDIFKFIEGAYIYADYVAGNRKAIPVYKLSEKAVSKVVTLLKGGSQPITNKDKVFILPGNNTSKKTLEDAVKLVKAKNTQSFNKATVIVSNDTIVNNYNLGYYNNYPFIVKAIDDSSLHLTHDEVDDSTFEIYRKEAVYTRCLPLEYLTNNYTDYPDYNFNRRLLYTEGLLEQTYLPLCMNYGNRLRAKDNHVYITDAGLALLTAIFTKKVKIVSEKAIIQQNATVLDESMFETLNQMYNGSKENKTVANKILYNCSVDESYFYIVKLIVKHKYKIENLRSKEYKFFLSQIQPKYLNTSYESLYEYQFMNVWELITECLNRGIYSEVIHKNLETEINEEIENILKANIDSKFTDCIDINYKVNYDKIKVKFKQ